MPPTQEATQARPPNQSQADPAAGPRTPLLVAAPRDYFLGPVFAATKQNGPRELTVCNRRYLIGGFHPIHPTRVPPALDVRHARAIFALLSFRNPAEPRRIIRFSFNEFCCRYAHSNGGRYARDIKGILGDLMDTYLRVTELATSVSHDYRLLEHVDIERRPIRRKDDSRAGTAQQELWLNGATLSEAFYALLNRIVELQHLKLDVFTAIRSPLAQAIYLYIPSRAVHHSERQPFEITITTLLQQVSHPVPNLKWLRKKLFTQNRNSILAQLDRRETLSGAFRVKLAETADGEDCKLQAWVDDKEPTKQPPRLDSKMTRAFLQAGHSSEELHRRLQRNEPLDDYETDLLRRGRVELNGNQRFFEMAKALLGRARLHALLAEAKGDALEGIPPTKTPTARLIFRIMEAIKGSSPAGGNGTGNGSRGFGQLSRQDPKGLDN